MGLLVNLKLNNLSGLANFPCDSAFLELREEENPSSPRIEAHSQNFEKNFHFHGFPYVLKKVLFKLIELARNPQGVEARGYRRGLMKSVVTKQKPSSPHSLSGLIHFIHINFLGYLL